MKQEIKIKIQKGKYNSSIKSIALSVPNAYKQDDKKSFRACISLLAKR